MPLKLNSTGGGSVTLDTPSTASAYTLTVPAITGTAVVTGSTATVSQAMLASGVAGNGPAFAVFRNATQSLTSAVFTKIQFNNEQFDTNNNFDSTTNYRFTPTIAGYYYIDCHCYFSGASITFPWALIYKNGSAYSAGTAISPATAEAISLTSEIIYLNGSTDYIEFYAYASGGTSINIGSTAVTLTRASGVLVRAA